MENTRLLYYSECMEAPLKTDFLNTAVVNEGYSPDRPGIGEIEEIRRDYEKIITSFTPENRQEKTQRITNALHDLIEKNDTFRSLNFTEKQQAILRLKLARHFQKNDELDIHTVFDALTETPAFIDVPKGSLLKLLEIHETKTLMKIAETRKQRVEAGDKSTFNPWENLFTTKSGKYYVARLSNMPHLQQESDYMKHCVGTSDSYVNKLKRGSVEIFSFRNVPKMNPRTQKLEGDTPILTIEYDMKAKVIKQVKKINQAYLSSNDAYFKDVIDALKQLRTTQTDSGQRRDFIRIEPSELRNFMVGDYTVMTDKGNVSFRDFHPESGAFVFKHGKMSVTSNHSLSEVIKIIQIVEGLSFQPDEIARHKDDVTPKTKVYIGPIFPDFFTWLPDHIKHIYSSFPEGRITRESVVVGDKTGQEYIKTLTQMDHHMSDSAKSILESPEFKTMGPPQQIDVVVLRVQDLGLPKGSTTTEIYQHAESLGLELCPPEVGPELRLKNEGWSLYEPCSIGMKIIVSSDGTPLVFNLRHEEDETWLDSILAHPSYPWFPDQKFTFRLKTRS